MDVSDWLYQSQARAAIVLLAVSITAPGGDCPVGWGQSMGHVSRWTTAVARLLRLNEEDLQ